MGESIDLDEFKQVLLEKRRELVGDARALQREGSPDAEAGHSGMSNHMADQASDTFEQEFTYARLTASSMTLQEIDDALDRIAEGTYGVCAECSAQIPLRRLHIKPQAIHCIDCQRKEESP